MIDVNNVYLKNEININLKSFNLQLDSKFGNLFFCINPFNLLIQNILDLGESKIQTKSNNIYPF
jgi:hypothetical protein